MSVMTLLLAAEDAGVGALFFGIFRGERELRRALGIAPVMQILGAVALGYPAPPDAAGPDDTGPGVTPGRNPPGASGGHRTRSSTEGPGDRRP